MIDPGLIDNYEQAITALMRTVETHRIRMVCLKHDFPREPTRHMPERIRIWLISDLRRTTHANYDSFRMHNPVIPKGLPSNMFDEFSALTCGEIRNMLERCGGTAGFGHSILTGGDSTCIYLWVTTGKLAVQESIARNIMSYFKHL